MLGEWGLVQVLVRDILQRERAVCQSCACMCDCLCEGMEVDSCLSAYVGQYILVCIYIDTYAIYIYVGV